MSTGDVGGNLRRLQQDLRALRYPAPFDERLALEGDAVTLLPVLHYLLLGFSRHVARFIASTGYEWVRVEGGAGRAAQLVAKADLRFVEGAFKLMREQWSYRPALTPQQFLQPGFVERKLLLLHDVAQLCRTQHNQLVREQRNAGVVASNSGSTRLFQGRPHTAHATAAAQVTVQVVQGAAVATTVLRTPSSCAGLPNRSALSSLQPRAPPSPPPPPVTSVTQVASPLRSPTSSFWAPSPPQLLSPPPKVAAATAAAEMKVEAEEEATAVEVWPPPAPPPTTTTTRRSLLGTLSDCPSPSVHQQELQASAVRPTVVETGSAAAGEERMAALEARMQTAEAATRALQRTVQEQAALLVLLSTRLRVLEAPPTPTPTPTPTPAPPAHAAVWPPSPQRVTHMEEAAAHGSSMLSAADGVMDDGDLQQFMAQVSGRCEQTRALLQQEARCHVK